MTPKLSQLVANADAVKLRLVMAITMNEAAAKAAAQAKAEHELRFAEVVKLTDELAQARAAIEAVLDSDYGPVPEVPNASGPVAAKVAEVIEKIADVIAPPKEVVATPPALEPATPEVVFVPAPSVTLAPAEAATDVVVEEITQ